MRLTRPAAHVQPSSDRPGQVRPPGIECARRALQVGETGAVFDVQQRRAVETPRRKIGPAGELVVLVGLVDAQADSRPAQVRGLELARRRMHGIDRQTGLPAMFCNSIAEDGGVEATGGVVDASWGSANAGSVRLI